jgi:hypothetical protein
MAVVLYPYALLSPAPELLCIILSLSNVFHLIHSQIAEMDAEGCAASIRKGDARKEIGDSIRERTQQARDQPPEAEKCDAPLDRDAS